MENNLTDRAFWETYWKSKKDIIVNIPPDYLFGKQLKNLIEAHPIKTTIELGGFPGYYTVFLKKYFNLKSTLLDFFVYAPITHALLQKNGLRDSDVSIIETDLFEYESTRKYDMVISCGLIEHFEDTKDIIERHVKLLNSQGVLFITLPNFRSVNGWFQKKFDPENYNKHNIHSMDTRLLSDICKQLDLQDIKVYYHGKFSVWLESERKHAGWVYAFKKIAWFTGKILTKVIPLEHKRLAPYIVIEAVKPA